MLFTLVKRQLGLQVFFGNGQQGLNLLWYHGDENGGSMIRLNSSVVITFISRCRGFSTTPIKMKNINSVPLFQSARRQIIKPDTSMHQQSASQNSKAQLGRQIGGVSSNASSTQRKFDKNRQQSFLGSPQFKHLFRDKPFIHTKLNQSFGREYGHNPSKQRHRGSGSS
jgi:hypothetical protein